MATSLDRGNPWVKFLIDGVHRWYPGCRRSAFFASAVLEVACGSPWSASNSTATSASSQVASATVGQADTTATHATSQTTAPARQPPPPGTVAIPGTTALAELCEGPQACPLLKLAAAQAHCRKKASKTEAWRLPTKDEAQALATISPPAQAQVFHWTSTPFVQDPKQVWIVMPAQLKYTTTYSGDHKNFVTRCVRDFADSPAP